MTNYIDLIIKDSIPIWDECANTKFVEELVLGTLSYERFQKYIIEDTRYLLNYAKCYAYLITKCNTLEEIRMFYDVLSFVKEGETSIRRKYIKEFGYTDLDVEESFPDVENQIYINSMINWCSTGTLVEGLMSVLPCMLSYEYIFNNYLKDKIVLENNPYKELLESYIGPYMSDVCKAWSNFANDMLNKYPESIEKCKTIFRFSSIREKEFWLMSYNNKIEFKK